MKAIEVTKETYVSDWTFELARLSEERKAIEKREKELKTRLKEYMNKNGLTEFRGKNNSKVSMVERSRINLDKDRITEDLGLQEVAQLNATYGKETVYSQLTARFVKNAK